MPKPYKVQDHYFLEAKRQGYRARSAFKLLEIQEKFCIAKKGDEVLDLGCAPGSFLQVLAKFVGSQGKITGIDLQETEELPYPNVKTYTCDIFDEQKIYSLLGDQKFNLITSDLAPKTSGIKDTDQFKSIELNEQVLKLAEKYLKKNGNLILKVFVGADFQPFLKKIKQKFQKVSCFKPSSSRDRSFETFVIAKNPNPGWD